MVEVRRRGGGGGEGGAGVDIKSNRPHLAGGEQLISGEPHIVVTLSFYVVQIQGQSRAPAFFCSGNWAPRGAHDAIEAASMSLFFGDVILAMPGDSYSFDRGAATTTMRLTPPVEHERTILWS